MPPERWRRERRARRGTFIIVARDAWLDTNVMVRVVNAIIIISRAIGDVWRAHSAVLGFIRVRSVGGVFTSTSTPSTGSGWRVKRCDLPVGCVSRVRCRPIVFQQKNR